MYIAKHLSFGLLLLLTMSDLNSADVRMCGKSLTQFLDMVCVDGFNPKNLKAKKSVPLIDFNQNSIENDLQHSLFSSLFMNELHGSPNHLIAKTRRRRFDGVADECCRKSCDISELLSYCI